MAEDGKMDGKMDGQRQTNIPPSLAGDNNYVHNKHISTP